MTASLGTILVLNAGSSSIRFALFDFLDESTLISRYRGSVDGIASAARLQAGTGRGDWQQHAINAPDHHAALQQILQWIAANHSIAPIVAAGHRVVHGGEIFTQPTQIDPTTLAALGSLTPLAPLHQPHTLDAIEAMQQLHPKLPQVACFDTAFHQTLPLHAQQYAIPRALFAQGLRRYGFHGLSYEYIASQLPNHLGDGAGGKVIIAHLGNGASLCALHAGRSIATTMGFTPLDGLPMGTRCGTLDPGILLYLMRERCMGEHELRQLLHQQSGLLGLSGISSDMRTLLDSAAPEAKQAIDFFTYRCAIEIGGLCSALGGLDALVFTGGIGEHAAEVRTAICQRLHWLGIQLDSDANAQHRHRISSEGPPVSVWALPTDEELMIARHTLNVLRPA